MKTNQNDLPNLLRKLFQSLQEVGYEWHPQTPDRLLNFRKEPGSFRPIVQWLGLGLPVDEDDLVRDGLTSVLLQEILNDQRLAKRMDHEPSDAQSKALQAKMAVSGHGELYIVHDHWPATPDIPYVHYAAESAWLSRACQRDLEGFVGKRVLDLGCSSGALAFEVIGVSKEVLGIDISDRSIEWANLIKDAYGFNNIHFEVAAIGTKRAVEVVGIEPWDRVLMNPPMVVPAKDAKYSHRDGGHLGIELPLLFIDFAARHLRQGGEMICLVTNPIVDGRPAFFDRLNKRTWTILEKTCIHPRFNQTVARKQGYAELGIDHIELWFLHMIKN